MFELYFSVKCSEFKQIKINMKKIKIIFDHPYSCGKVHPCPTILWATRGIRPLGPTRLWALQICEPHQSSLMVINFSLVSLAMQVGPNFSVTQNPVYLPPQVHTIFLCCSISSVRRKRTCGSLFQVHACHPFLFPRNHPSHTLPQYVSLLGDHLSLIFWRGLNLILWSLLSALHYVTS